MRRKAGSISKHLARPAEASQVGTVCTAFAGDDVFGVLGIAGEQLADEIALRSADSNHHAIGGLAFVFAGHQRPVGIDTLNLELIITDAGFASL